MMNLEIEKTISHLKNGEVILCPTDTIWGLSCDATNEEAVEKIYSIKARDKSKSLIILVANENMLADYLELAPSHLPINFADYEKPVTVIYPGAKNLASNVYAQDKSIGIRIVKEGFAHQLINAFTKPIVSTSANFSNKPSALEFDDIEQELKDKVDYIVKKDFGNTKSQSSTIVKIENNEVKILRA